MIDSSMPVFPNNIIDLLDTAFKKIDTDLMVLKRPLRPTDPAQCVGIFGSLWIPNEESLEMGWAYPGEPTLSSYQIGIQALVKDGDEVRGLAVHSVLSKRVRSVVYHDPDLRVGLQTLSVTDGSSTERTRRWGIRTQRYMNNDIDGKFVYLSTMDMWLDTETS